MDKEVRFCKEELEERNKCIILLSFNKQDITMTVFADNGKVFTDVVLGNNKDSKEKIMIAMRKFFKQGN